MSNNDDLEDLDTFREPQRGFHHVEVPAPAPQPWPVEPRHLAVRFAGAGRELGLDDFLTSTSATSCVVVVDGVLVHEWYAAGVGPQDRLLGNSATKSALALLTGIAVRDGLLELGSRVADHVPELRRGGYADVTLRHLLTMTTGVGWVEDYHDPDSEASRMIARWRAGAGGIREQLASIPAGDEPGTRYAYCSPDSMVLDWVRERATGQSFPDALAEVWSVVGAEQPGVVGLDGPVEGGGVAMAAAALAASARDWARIGWLQVDGSWAGSPVVDPAWVAASSRPELSFLAPGRLPSTITTHAGFGYHWWPLDADGTRVMADGMRGQFVYVDRPRRTVVVKTSAWPYADAWWDRQCRDLSYLALPAIAEAAVVGS
ncbi:serine hydrolase domain-containing protein [Nocardioides cynanchi]|uniref:serine hydrolase domain-containing protein n=1 Tax=Nocardioides cynanchi TaxID=2558918 RepID=UPI0017847D8C|nr:serine hydrolase [Nocardioides cynanchi]